MYVFPSSPQDKRIVITHILAYMQTYTTLFTEHVELLISRIEHYQPSEVHLGEKQVLL